MAFFMCVCIHGLWVRALSVVTRPDVFFLVRLLRYFYLFVFLRRGVVVVAIVCFDFVRPSASTLTAPLSRRRASMSSPTSVARLRRWLISRAGGGYPRPAVGMMHDKPVKQNTSFVRTYWLYTRGIRRR